MEGEYTSIKREFAERARGVCAQSDECRARERIVDELSEVLDMFLTAVDSMRARQHAQQDIEASTGRWRG